MTGGAKLFIKLSVRIVSKLPRLCQILYDVNSETYRCVVSGRERSVSVHPRTYTHGRQGFNIYKVYTVYHCSLIYTQNTQSSSQSNKLTVRRLGEI